MCPDCSVKSIPIPTVEPALPLLETVEEAVEVTVEKPVKVKTNTKEKLLSKLAKLSDVDCTVSAEYLKGYLAASLELLKGD
jgi:hypothetical protein